MASRMFSNDGYFPVPTMRRDLNSFPPSHSDVSYMKTSVTSLLIRSARLRLHLALPSAHRMDDLHLVAVLELGFSVAGALRDLAVQGDRGELAAHLEMCEEPIDAEPVGQLHRLAVDGDRHKKTAHLSTKGCGPVIEP